MAYITPDTNIYLLQDVILDPSYINSIYFASTSAQFTYFYGKKKYSLNNYTYQRVNSGVLRVQINSENLLDCTYMMFQNHAYGTKWFYAFITKVDYVNDVTSDIYYVIDDLQSWLGEMVLKPCMIERTHVAESADTIGANINPEPVQIAEYVYDNSDPTSGAAQDINVVLQSANCYVLIQVCDVEDSVTYGTKYDNNFSGAKLYQFAMDSTSDVSAILTFLASYSQRPDAILGMYLVPKILLGTPSQSHQLTYGATAISHNGLLCGKAKTTDKFGTYVPKNKKLYTYPYNCCEVYTNEGQKMKIRYEFCGSLEARVDVNGTITNPVQLVVRPTNYKGYGLVSPTSYVPCMDEHLTLSNFPQCSWTNDYYSSWISQNALPLAVGTALSVAGVLAPTFNPTWEATLTPEGEVTQSKIKHFMQLDPNNAKHSKWFDYDTDAYNQAAENAMGALPNAVSALQQMYIASIHADQFRGNANTNCVDVANGRMGIYSHRAHIPEQQARMIDDFFEKYGYAIGQIQTPNLHVKSKWTYVKTQGCTVGGRCPASVLMHIEKLFDRGITWWANGDEVGNYSLNNHA